MGLENGDLNPKNSSIPMSQKPRFEIWNSASLSQHINHLGFAKSSFAWNFLHHLGKPQ
jgi:hypothetical protein